MIAVTMRVHDHEPQSGVSAGREQPRVPAPSAPVSMGSALSSQIRR
jgi:hypothetical protein